MLEILGIVTLSKIIDKLADTFFDFSVQKLLDIGISKVFPKDSYKNELISIIYKTIEEFEKKNPAIKDGNKFPFYHSQILLEHYSMYVLFNEEKHSKTDLQKELNTNPNIIEPNKEQLESFYELFKTNANSNEYLKKLFVEENYKERIFDISKNLQVIDKKLDSVLDSLKKLETLKSAKAKFKVNADMFVLPSFELLEADYYFFLKEEVEQINNCVESIKTDSDNYFLLTGYPSTGKTISTLKIYQQLTKNGFEVFYLNISQNLSFDRFKSDLNKLSDRENIVFIIEDIHLNLSFGAELLSLEEEFPTFKFIITSRFLSEDVRRDTQNNIDIFKQLEDSNLRLESFNTPQHIYKKALGVIENCKSYLDHQGINREIGDIKKVIENSKSNLYKLAWMLQYWLENNVPLSEITEKTIEDHIYRKYLYGLNQNEINKIHQFATLYAYEIEFIADPNQIESSKQNGILFKNENDFHSFMHSMFARLLLDSIYRANATLSARYRDDRNALYLKNIENYLNEVIGDSDGFVENIYSFLYNIGISDNINLFNKILSSDTVKKQFFKYVYDSNQMDSDQLVNLIQLIRIFSKRSFEDYCNSLYFSNRNLTEILKRGTKNASAISYIETHKNKFEDLKNKNVLAPFKPYELKDVFRKASLNSLTLTIRLLPNNELRTTAINVLSVEEWKQKFNSDIHFGIYGNSLAELKKVKPELATSILKTVDIKRVSAKIHYQKFDYITKTLSELKQIDFATTSEILASIDVKILKRKSKQASVEQIGIGLSRLYDIDQSVSKEIFEDLDIDFLSNLFENKPLTAFGHILKEFRKIEPLKAQNLIRHTLKKEFVINKLNSAKITTVDLFTFYLLFSQLDVRKEGQELLKKVNLDIIEGRVQSSNIKHSVQLVNAINEIEPSYGKKLVKHIPDEKLIKVINDSNTEITDLPSIFLYLKNVDFDNAKRVYNLVENITIIKKCLVRKFRIQPIFNSLKPLYSLDKKKTIDLLNNLFAHNVFKSKIQEADIENFINSVSIAFNIKEKIAENIIATYSESLVSANNGEIQFAKFADALYRLSKINKEVVNTLLNSFIPRLEKDIHSLTFYQLKAGLCALAKVDKVLATRLLKMIPIEELKKKSEVLLVDKKNIEGQLGEIKCVNTEIWKSLKEHLK
ncbi:MAG: ATP-binding protein [Bacteroidales bacterium]|jgi:hypothetical protein|nr:ATP-binding protein [Bacteroidales bacterium]